MESDQNFIRSFDKKPSGMKKSISLIECVKKSSETRLDDSQNTDIIQTNLERMIDTLNKIKKRLLLIQEIQQAAEIDWMVDTLLKNRLNDVVVKLEKEGESNSHDIEKMLELLEEYSSEFNFKRSIEKLHSLSLSKKASKTTLGHILDEENYYKNYDEIFQLNFNIFDFCTELGRENVLPTITGNALHYFGVDAKLDKERLKNFLIEVRNGYKKSNYYHNVTVIYKLGHPCSRCYTDNQSNYERIKYGRNYRT